MAKDNREIRSGVRIGKKVFTEGMEDDLAAALSAAQLERLLEKGVIAGDFIPKKSSSKKESSL